MEARHFARSPEPVQTLRTIAEWVDEKTQLLTVALQSVADLGASTRIIAQMRAAGAVTPQSAQRVHLYTEAEERAFERLLASRVVRARGPGRYYLDERRTGWDPRDYSQ
jgi:hypothetical protein